MCAELHRGCAEEQSKQTWAVEAGFVVPGRHAGTWDLGPFAAGLAPGQTSPPATKYKETMRD